MSHYNEQREADELWRNAPSDATHYADGSFLQKLSGTGNQFLRCNEQTGLWNAKLSGNIECYPDYQERPKPHQNVQDGLKQPDPVNHPKHYAIAPGVEAIDIIKASLTPEQFEGYLLGNFLKYRLRAGDKDDLQQDIAKSNWYRERLNR